MVVSRFVPAFRTQHGKHRGSCSRVSACASGCTRFLRPFGGRHPLNSQRLLNSTGLFLRILVERAESKFLLHLRSANSPRPKKKRFGSYPEITATRWTNPQPFPCRRNKYHIYSTNHVFCVTNRISLQRLILRNKLVIANGVPSNGGPPRTGCLTRLCTRVCV